VLLAADLSRHLDPVLFAADAGLALDPWQASLVREQPRRAILNCSRQSGKSTTVSVLALHVACFEPDSLIVLASPSQRQSAELLRSIRGLHGRLENVPEMDAESVLKIELANRSRILALPGSQEGKNIRGLSNCRLCLVDEASRIEDGLMASIRPMLAVNARGSLIMLSTPAGKRGTFYEIWHNGDPAWTRIRIPASACPRISAEFLQEELRDLGPTRFAEEYELTFVDDLTAAFSTVLIDGIVDHNLKALWT
jgi:Terminase large subunit, T4likevirus-type, N-terminal